MAFPGNVDDRQNCDMMYEEIDISDEEEWDFEHEPLTDDLVERIRASLSYRPSIRVSLDKINTEWERKMRFSILEPCVSCGVANHVDVVDHPAREVVCDLCNNKETPTKTVVYKIIIPIGVYHGSTIVLPDKGHVYDERTKGNVVVTILDEPHEHYLRIYDDLIVCYQIDRLESKNGLTRLFTPPGCPDSESIVLQTEPGCEIKDNDVFLVTRLGLKISPRTDIIDELGDEMYESGDLYVLFFVRSKGSINPVKLKNLKLHISPDCDDSDDTVLINSADHSSDSPISSSRDNKQNGVRSPRKRRRNGEVDESAKSIPIPQKVPAELLLNQPPYHYDNKLSFLDRLVNHPGAIPLPYRDPVAEELSLNELESLWKRQGYNSWWNRFSYPRDRKLFPDSCVSDPRREDMIGASPSGGLTQPRHCSSCLGDKPLFNLKDDFVDTGEEAIKELLTRNIRANPNYLKFSLKSSLPRCQVLRLLKRAKEYLIDPVTHGRM